MSAPETDRLCPHCGKVSSTTGVLRLCGNCGRSKDGSGPISDPYRPRYDIDDDAEGGLGLLWVLVPGLAIVTLLLIFVGAELFVLGLVLLVLALFALDVLDWL